MTNDHHGSENVARDLLGWTRAKKDPELHRHLRQRRLHSYHHCWVHGYLQDLKREMINETRQDLI